MKRDVHFVTLYFSSCIRVVKKIKINVIVAITLHNFKSHNINKSTFNVRYQSIDPSINHSINQLHISTGSVTHLFIFDRDIEQHILFRSVNCHNEKGGGG
jgi:hypothetical protein